MTWTENVATVTELGITHTVLRPAFVVELYGDARVLAAGHTIFDKIWALFPKDKPFFCINKRGREYKQLTPQSLTRLLRTLDRLGEEGQFYMLKDAPNFHVDAYSAELHMGNQCAMVHFALPPSYVDDVGPEAAIEMFRGFVDAHPFLVATAGFGFHATWCRESEMAGMPVNIKTALRYFGLNVRNRGEELYLDGRLKTAHWLTFLGDAALAKLGGKAAAHELGLEVGVIDAGTGVILRAGDEPPVGDIDRQAPDIEPMRRVNEFIRPIRIDAWQKRSSNLFFIDPDAANAWLTRLDRTRE